MADAVLVLDIPLDRSIKLTAKRFQRASGTAGWPPDDLRGCLAPLRGRFGDIARGAGGVAHVRSFRVGLAAIPEGKVALLS